jgi:transcriptional regulatory protein GAL4
VPYYRHLTEVEERLERAETILKSLFTDAQVSHMLDHGTINFSGISTSADGPLLATDTTSSTQDGSSSGRPEPLAGQSFAAEGFDQLSDQQSLGDAELFRSRSATDQGPRGVILASESGTGKLPLPFESAPSAEDDFEWDEQESSWSVPDPEGRSAVVDSTEGDVHKVMDGMATLSVGDSQSGYVGITSGAALLRLIWMNTDDGSERDIDERNARRKYLEGLFNRRQSESLLPPPWLRTQPSLTRAVVDTLVDAYFKLYHPSFPILHEATFRAQLSNTTPLHSRSTWHILANVVVALGSFVSSTCSSDTDTTIFRATKERLSIGVLEAGNLTLVQIFGLAANYLQKRNRPNSGYNYGGLALRLAIGLGLHKEFDGWKIDPLKMEIRRRVWWSLCVLDVGATITYGRPLNWPQVGVETALPLNIHEQVGAFHKRHGAER